MIDLHTEAGHLFTIHQSERCARKHASMMTGEAAAFGEKITVGRRKIAIAGSVVTIWFTIAKSVTS